MDATFHTTNAGNTKNDQEKRGKCSLTLIDITWTAFKF